MCNTDSDLDVQMNSLESEWREVYEASIIAREDYHALTANRSTQAKALDLARKRLERAEQLKSRIMAKIERLELSTLG